ncbi:nostrin [Ixodes scapularis]
MTSFRDSFWGPTGFEELRRLLKQGADFSKEVAGVLQERSELEASHAKGLAKLSQRLSRAARDAIGSTAGAWQEVATQLDREAQLHRALSRGLSEAVACPLRSSWEAQSSRRKALESGVERRLRQLREHRAAQERAKRCAHACARHNEQAQDLALDPKGSSRGRLLTDRDLAKLESKRRKAEAALTKAEADYYGACVAAEHARQEWETLLYQTGGWLQALEEERLEALGAALKRYAQEIATLGPQATQCAERVQEQAACVDVGEDILEAVRLRGTAPNVPEQLLPDFYAEDLASPMKPQRRREALERLLELLQKDLDTERRGKQGVESLAQAFREAPRFGDEDAQLRVEEKLQQLRQSLAFLEASRHKVQCVLAGLEGRPRPPHPLATHLEQRRDRQGLSQTVLKVPPWLQRRPSSCSCAGSEEEVRDAWDRGSADGHAAPTDPPSEASSVQGDNVSTEGLYANSLPSRCQALYDYRASMEDELSLRSGDVVTVHGRAEEGWWHGELNGSYGLFPASYVQELEPGLPPG